MLKRFKRTIKRIIGINRIFSIKASFFKLLRFFIKKPIPVNDDGKKNLHLGCGSIDYPGFVNVDLRPYPHIHYVRDIEDISIFKSNEFDLVYVSHCLEHVPHPKLKKVLSDWRRVLKTGGILRLAVPDFDTLVKIYEENNRDIELIRLQLMGEQTYEYNFHYVNFTHKSLTDLLYKVGFKEVRPWHYGSDKYTSIPDYSGHEVEINKKKYWISLNLEGVK